MKREDKKGTFILIIVLLIIALPLAGGALTFKLIGNPYRDDKEKIKENPNKEFFYDGKLYFYDGDNLLGIYDCNNESDYCGYAVEIYDDNNYSFNYYYDGNEDKLELINNRYAFIVDTQININDQHHRNAEIILYDVIKQQKLSTYKAVKNYTLGLANNRVIVQTNDKAWGIIGLNAETPIPLTTFDYEYISVANRTNSDGLLKTDYFVARKDNMWSILNGNDFSKNISYPKDIVLDYNENNIITKLENIYYIYNHNNSLVLDTSGYNDLKILDKYIVTVDRTNKLAVINPITGDIVSDYYDVSGKPYTVTILEGNTLNVIIDGIEYKTTL